MVSINRNIDMVSINQNIDMVSINRNIDMVSINQDIDMVLVNQSEIPLVKPTYIFTVNCHATFALFDPF